MPKSTIKQENSLTHSFYCEDLSMVPYRIETLVMFKQQCLLTKGQFWKELLQALADYILP